MEDGRDMSTERKSEESTERLNHDRVEFIKHRRGGRPEGKSIGNNRFGDSRDKLHDSLEGS